MDPSLLAAKEKLIEAQKTCNVALANEWVTADMLFIHSRDERANWARLKMDFIATSSAFVPLHDAQDDGGQILVGNSGPPGTEIVIVLPREGG